MTLSFKIFLIAATYLLTACISLPSNVAAELEEPNATQSNHYRPIAPPSWEIAKKDP